MKAFIGRDFDENYDSLVNKIVTHIEACDIKCVDARKAKSGLVDEKVTDLIRGCDIFVGIFTRDKTFLLNDGFLKRIFPGKRVQYSTSTWVIQESGFALGTGKELILLIEKGVVDFPELHGNIEYISFERDSIQYEFTRLSQIIGSIKTRRTGGVAEMATEESKQEETTVPKEEELQEKEEGKGEWKEVFAKIIDAFRRKDYTEAQRIFSDESEAVLDGDDKIFWHAVILRLSHKCTDKSAFRKLQKLVEENSNNPRVIKQLGLSYKEMREFKKATETFLLAKDKYNVGDTEKRDGLIDAYIQAANCMADDDDLNGALDILTNLLFDSNFQDSKAQIFQAMAKISQDKEDIERFFIYAEAALDIDPCNLDLRFNLAYTYNQNKEQKLSLLHYKNLTTAGGSTALNNLGVQYENFEIKGKCIDSYFKSADQNETLAMANLAQKYLNEGFIKDARELVDRANKLSNEGVKVNYRVGKAQERINELLEYEAKKEKEILLEAEKERKFRVVYSKAFCSESTITQNNIEGIWETQWGKFELKFEENVHSFSIEGNIRVEDTFASLASLISGGQKQEKEFKDRNVRITGTIENMSGMYSIQVEDKKASTILTGEIVHETTGYMIINEDCNCIEIMEKTKDDKTEFKQWKKHEENVGK